MKTSNKILLGGLLTITLVLVAVHVALYARYKAGNYVPFNEAQIEEASQVKEFANARSIDIRFLNNVVVRIGDRLKVEQYDEHNDAVVLREQNGKVELLLKDSTNSEQVFNYMIVYVPENSTIITHKARIRVEGQGNKTIHQLSVIASGGQINFTPAKNMLQIDSLNVNATNGAGIELNDARINKLSVQLNASELSENNAIIQELKLNADSSSRISLQYKNLSNLINQATAHE